MSYEISTTGFDKKLFTWHGGYLYYGAQRRFVARFKHSGTPFTRLKFIKELVASHTAEGYFMALDSGEAPLAILRDRNEDWYYDILEAFSGRNLRTEAA